MSTVKKNKQRLALIHWVVLLLTFFSFSGCRKKSEEKYHVQLGIDVLEEDQFKILKGKKIGILTNKSGVDSAGRTTWRVLKEAPSVELKAIFAPVHGLELNFLSLETFYNDEVDGIPIYSVFAHNSRPKKEWLKDLDAVVVDLQGLGIRYYNYWAFMIYMMAACFEQGIEVIVLDRPNPFSGEFIGGPSMDSKYTSIWGPIPDMPLFHGLTIGEIAKYVHGRQEAIKTHSVTDNGITFPGIEIPSETMQKGKLTVVKMKGWSRFMTWDDIDVPWKATSPFIQNIRSASEYGLLSISIFLSDNYGFNDGGENKCDFLHFKPSYKEYLYFNTFCSDFISRGDVTKCLKKFLPNPESLVFMGSDPDVLNIRLCTKGFKDVTKNPPAAFGLCMFHLAQKHARKYYWNNQDTYLMECHVGDPELFNKLIKDEPINFRHFMKKWNEGAERFMKKAKSFLLYE